MVALPWCNLWQLLSPHLALLIDCTCNTVAATRLASCVARSWLATSVSSVSCEPASCAVVVSTHFCPFQLHDLSPPPSLPLQPFLWSSSSRSSRTTPSISASPPTTAMEAKHRVSVATPTSWGARQTGQASVQTRPVGSTTPTVSFQPFSVPSSWSPMPRGAGARRWPHPSRPPSLHR